MNRIIHRIIQCLGIIILALTIAQQVFYAIERQNPCSVWGEHQERCNSDRFADMIFAGNLI